MPLRQWSGRDGQAVGTAYAGADSAAVPQVTDGSGRRWRRSRTGPGAVVHVTDRSGGGGFGGPPFTGRAPAPSRSPGREPAPSGGRRGTARTAVTRCPGRRTGAPRTQRTASVGRAGLVPSGRAPPSCRAGERGGRRSRADVPALPTSASRHRPVARTPQDAGQRAGGRPGRRAVGRRSAREPTAARPGPTTLTALRRHGRAADRSGSAAEDGPRTGAPGSSRR